MSNVKISRKKNGKLKWEGTGEPVVAVEVQPEEPRRYPCKRCGGAVKVSIAEARAHLEQYHPTSASVVARQASEANRLAWKQRMGTPEYQAKLRAARIAKHTPATEGE